MAQRRYRDGGVTVTLDGDLERFVVDAVKAAGGAALDLMEAAAEEQAAQSRLQWYQHVERRTGLSGDIQAITTISPKQIMVSVGSTDPRTVEFKNVRRRKAAGETAFPGKETRVVSFVHEPGPLSTHLVAVDEATYWKTPSVSRGPARALFVAEHGAKAWQDIASQAEGAGSVATQYLVYRPNPLAAGGRRLLQLLVRAPTQRLAVKLAPLIAEEIARRLHA